MLWQYAFYTHLLLETKRSNSTTNLGKFIYSLMNRNVPMSVHFILINNINKTARTPFFLTCLTVLVHPNSLLQIHVNRGWNPTRILIEDLLLIQSSEFTHPFPASFANQQTDKALCASQRNDGILRLRSRLLKLVLEKLCI